MGANVPGQAAGLPALRRRRRRLPGRLRRGGGAGLPGLHPGRARRVAVPRRRDPPAAAGRGHGARDSWRTWSCPPWSRCRSRRPGRSWRRSRPCGRPGRRWARSSTACCRGAAGELAYRLYRPAVAGPHPVVAYFHGGGWVLGSLDSDDPFCRDLCARLRRRRRVGQLPARPRGPLPRRRRRRVRRRAVDRRPRRRARGDPRPARGGGMERRRQHRRRGLPAGPRRRRARHRRAAAADAGHRLPT